MTYRYDDIITVIQSFRNRFDRNPGNKGHSGNADSLSRCYTFCAIESMWYRGYWYCEYLSM